MSELLPCPFCKGKADRVSFKDWNHDKGIKDICARIECDGCGMSGPEFMSANYSGIGDEWDPAAGQEAAIKHWNTRANILYSFDSTGKVHVS